jgi:hypothetical protein
MKYILELDSQAKKKGGRVISLLGNHELYPHYLQNDKNFINDFVKKTDLNKFKKVYKMDRMKDPYVIGYENWYVGAVNNENQFYGGNINQAQSLYYKNI